MSGFLNAMAASSAERAAQARQREPYAALERRALEREAAPTLQLSQAGFDVIAELKLRSPAAGQLADQCEDLPGRVGAYARGGAAAVSVLTEPSRFDGCLDHLARAAAVLKPFEVPAMRKDFLVDPYQVLEARAVGAGGVLVILRMLPQSRVIELLDVAAACGLFVLLEAFDAADLELGGRILGERAADESLLLGINSRDLQTLEVIPQRFAALAPMLPPGTPCVAESGVSTPSEARNVRDLGYRVALIGTALMSCADPAVRLAEILESARNFKS
ncbi:MAG: indole-3-glycerol phosphate synthase TrpC [Steroidobacteraceae bacterium]